MDNQAMESLTQIRVRYAETDAMGIVHHGAPSAIASEAPREREDSAGRCPIGG
jgi:acyl-CoA thioesterase FadM